MSHLLLDTALSFDTAVSLGLVPGWSLVRIIGHNNDIDSGTEDLWGQGGVKTWPTAAGAVTVVSSSINDAAAGTGARTVLVEGLDANYNPISELYTMNGTTDVVGLQLFFRVQRIQAVTCGSGGENAGAITATLGGNVQSSMAAAFGASRDGHYTVQAGYQFLVTLYELTCGRLGTGDLELNAFIREYNANSDSNYNAWRCVSSIDMSEGSVPQVAPRGRIVQARADIRIQGISNAANLATSVVIVGFLIDNNALIQSR